LTRRIIIIIITMRLPCFLGCGKSAATAGTRSRRRQQRRGAVAFNDSNVLPPNLLASPRKRLLVTTILPATMLAFAGMLAIERTVFVPEEEAIGRGFFAHQHSRHTSDLPMNLIRGFRVGGSENVGTRTVLVSTPAGAIQASTINVQIKSRRQEYAATTEQGGVADLKRKTLKFGPHNTADTFGACLKIMDDNHWLSEWLGMSYWFFHTLLLIDHVVDDVVIVVGVSFLLRVVFAFECIKVS